MHIVTDECASGAQTFCDILAKAFLLFSNPNQEFPVPNSDERMTIRVQVLRNID
jgi:hypothetical protein